MERPDVPHVRVFEGCVYIERAPGYWVQVCDAGLYKTFSPHESRYMIDKALKHGLERELPREISSQ
jgi:hypothetical protein